MNPFIQHTLMMLEDAGMSIRYPKINHVILDDDGKRTQYHSASLIAGRRVSIEQNPQMKFMMIFSLLDFFIDASHPGMEGKTYKQKYNDLPATGDYNIILRQLFRISKVIRNTLVHNPSSFQVNNSHLEVNYNFKGTDFRVKISLDALNSFYTAIVMYIRADMGKGPYFLGVMRSVYQHIISGIAEFSDDISGGLESPPHGLKLKLSVRRIMMNPHHDFTSGNLKIVNPETEVAEWEGVDYFIHHNGQDFIIPMEAMSADCSISEQDMLNNWKREGHFPYLKRSQG